LPFRSRGMSTSTTEPTIILRRNTADGKVVCIWSDGGITQMLGVYFPGTHKLPLAAALVVADEVCLYDSLEVSTLLKVAKKLARRGRQVLPGELRAAAATALEQS